MVIKQPISPNGQLNIAELNLPPLNQDDGAIRRSHDLLELLGEWHLSSDTHIAAQLSPYFQHPNFKIELVKNQFGERVGDLCHLATTYLTSQKSKSANPRTIRAEHLRKCYYLAYTNREALLFILAMRLVSLGDIDTFTTEERHQWANDNLSHYLPVFELLGLKNYAQALRDVSLRLTDKALYESLEKKIETYYADYQQIFLNFQRDINTLFASHNIPECRIKPQELSPANLYAFDQESNNTPTLPTHLIIDMLFDCEPDCYQALGALHHQFMPIKPVIDGLAYPRYNGYRALSTTLQIAPNVQVTVLIRTHEAERMNTHGILTKAQTGNLTRNVWWHTPHQTLTQKISKPTDPIGVFTPDGRWIYPLPQGFTVLDFAFRVHSELGAYARAFWVNGKNAVHHHTLHHTDLVEIEFDRNTPHITSDWLSSAYSAKTRRHIKSFLKRHAPPQTLEIPIHSTGRERLEMVLEREMGVYRLRFSSEQLEAKLSRWAAAHNYADVYGIYQAIELGTISADEVVCTLIEEELTPHIVRTDGKRVNHARIRLCRCWMMAEESVKWTLNSRITINTPIVGRMVGKDKPLMMVHRADCLNAPDPEDAIKLRWQKPSITHESAEVIIHAPFRFGIPSLILHKLEARQKTDSKDGLVLHRYFTETNAYQTTITCTVSSANIDHIKGLEDDLQNLQARGDIFDYSFWGLFHSDQIQLAGKFDKRQHNPYTLKQIRDQAMFFGRDEEIKRVLEYLREGETFIVLYGQKRIGKTSLMEHLAGHLIPKTTHADMIPIFFDALSLAPFNTTTLLRGLIETATPHITRIIKRATLPTELRLRPHELHQNPFTYFADWVKRVEKRLGNKRLLFMIDEFTRAEEEFRRGNVDESFFSGLQWLAGNQHIGFFICVHDHIYRHNTQSWGFLQRGHPLYLRTLDKQAAKKLIQLPLQSLYQFDDGVVDEIVDLTNGHPYFIQAICLELSVHMSKQDTHRIRRDDLQVATAIVLHNGEHYFNHFHNRIDALTNNVLKCVALLANDEDNQWVQRDQIQETALEWQLGTRINISESIGTLYQAGIIEAQKMNTKVAYRIPIKLFQFWLRQGTHPLIKSDIQRH
jgi:GTP pyrophosphokinase